MAAINKIGLPVYYLIDLWPGTGIDLHRVFAGILLVTAFSGCSSYGDQKKLERDSKQLATLYCEAKTLRIQRFELADRIRFAEDSLPELQDQKRHVISLRLDALMALIDPLTLQTKILADRIDSIQQVLYKGRYRDNEKKKDLDLAFQRAIEEICPD